MFGVENAAGDFYAFLIEGWGGEMDSCWRGRSGGVERLFLRAHGSERFERGFRSAPRGHVDGDLGVARERLDDFEFRGGEREESMEQERGRLFWDTGGGLVETFVTKEPISARDLRFYFGIEAAEIAGEFGCRDAGGGEFFDL